MRDYDYKAPHAKTTLRWQNHANYILKVVRIQLKDGPVVVRGTNLPRMQVTALEGDVLVGIDSTGCCLRVSYTPDFGLTGAQRLADPDHEDWWNLFGPFEVVVEHEGDALSDDFTPSLSQQVRRTRRKLGLANEGA